MAYIYNDPEKLCVGPEISIHEAISQMEVNRKGIVLVVDKDQKLLGTITDGDFRRAVLANFDLNHTTNQLLDMKGRKQPSTPVTTSAGTEPRELLSILREHKIRHLPLVDANQRVVDLVTVDDFVIEKAEPIQAVIMAGGVGNRLRPLTDEVPKPMLPVGGRPLLEYIVAQLRESGVKHINVAVYHQAEKITEYFGDGQEFGVEISYVNENQPLGTVGALTLLEAPTETLMVINGDILTYVDFRAMLAYHRENHAELTMAVQQYNVQVPYGVVELDGAWVKDLTEKPQLSFSVNAGIYLLEPTIYQLIPSGERFDMTDLIQCSIDDGRTVAAFPIREYWTDIGNHDDYQQAQEHFRNQDKPA